MNRLITNKAQLAIEQFGTSADQQLGQSEDELYAELGKRLSAIARSPAGSDNFDMTAGTGVEAYGPIDDLKNLGRKFFARWNQAAFGLICGSSADDAHARDELARAFNLGPEAIAATIAALLVTQLGMAAALAAVVGTLVVRLFLKPGHQAMCDCWREKMPH